jgi:hypothetical protein
MIFPAESRTGEMLNDISTVTRQFNEVLNERFLAYVLDAKQGLAFSEWEEARR